MRRGDIYYLHLKQNLGNIQAGIRPVIVIQNDVGNQYSPTTIVTCITSKLKKSLPTHLFIGLNGGLERYSTIMCEQIFTVNTKDLITYVGTITDQATLKQLDRCLRISLGIN